MLVPWRAFFCQMVLNISYHIVKASVCLGGHDIFAAIKENSPAGEFIANITIAEEPGANSVRLCLNGENAGWFYLEGRTIRLNSSFSRVLDREVHGSILLAYLTCYENNTIQNEYRVMVEILNENDNMPYFLEKTIQPRYISELTTVNSMVFTVKAKDADGDTIKYIIDKSSPDAIYFRIDLPSSGMVILDKPLDYETKTQLRVVMHAVEMNTLEKYNVTAIISVNVLDGDDQYPQFLPCSPVSEHTICTNPFYIANISEEEENSVLYFSPGPIHAEDGDKDILTPLTYTILSGEDNGRFTIVHETGEITLKRRVENRLLTPSFRLRIMAAQVDDPKKYTVTTALVRVVADNRFAPYFNKTTYKGFVIENSSPATLVSTYGNQVLMVQATDKDFRDGANPKITYALHPLAFSTKLYHITEDGILIAKTSLLRAFDRHILEVVATDQESGEVANTTVDIEVLPKGQGVPKSLFGEERLFGELNMGIAGGLAAVLLLLAVTAVCLLLRLLRRWRHRRDPAERGAVALGKNPNVVNSGRSAAFLEEAAYHNAAFMDNESPTSSGLAGKPGLYTKRDEMPPLPRWIYSNRDAATSMPVSEMLPILMPLESLPKIRSNSVIFNGQTGEKLIFSGDETAKKEKTNVLEESRALEVAGTENAQKRNNTEQNTADSYEPQTLNRPRAKCTVADVDKMMPRFDILPKVFQEYVPETVISVSIEEILVKSLLTSKETAQKDEDLLGELNPMGTREKVLIPTSPQSTFFCPGKVISAEKNQERKDAENAGCKPESLLGMRERCRTISSEDDPYRSMHPVICVGDEEDTTTDEEQMHKVCSEVNRIGRFSKDYSNEHNLQKQNSTVGNNQKLRDQTETLLQRPTTTSSTTGLFFFVQDSKEF